MCSSAGDTGTTYLRDLPGGPAAKKQRRDEAAQAKRAGAVARVATEHAAAQLEHGVENTCVSGHGPAVPAAAELGTRRRRQSAKSSTQTTAGISASSALDVGGSAGV